MFGLDFLLLLLKYQLEILAIKYCTPYPPLEPAKASVSTCVQKGAVFCSLEISACNDKHLNPPMKLNLY